MPEITIKHDANERVIGLGNDTAEASRQAGLAVAAAASASASAAYAESMTGPTYASTAAGLAATTDDEGFAVDSGDGTVTVYLNDEGVAVAQRTLATTAALASGSAILVSPAAVGFQQTGTGAVARTSLAKLQENLSAKDFGAVGDGVTDDTAALQLAVTAAAASGQTLTMPSGDYLVSGSIQATDNLRIVFQDGAKITANAGTYSTGYVLDIQGSISAISDLSANVSLGARSLTFTSAPTLAFDDLILIHNPTTGSWSGHRTSHCAGEFCKVIALSSTTATLQAPLFDGYTAAAVDVYKVNPVEVELVNPCFESNGTPLGLLFIKYGRRVKITNPQFRHANNSAILLSRCVDYEITGGNVTNLGDGGDDYGLAQSNCQGGTITGGQYYGRRHAVTSGGDSTVGNVPCREITYRDVTTRNDTASGTHSADVHGNGEFVKFSGCTIYGGATFQGANITYDYCDIIGGTSLGVAVFGAEILGGYHRLTNSRVHLYANPTDSSGLAAVDFGGSANVITANTTRDVTVIVEGNTFYSSALGTNTRMVQAVNRGGSMKINASVQGNKFLVNDMFSALYVRNISGTAASDFIIADNNTTTSATVPFSIQTEANYGALPVLRCQATEWTDSVTLSTSASFKTGTSKAFKWKFPRNPVVQASKSGNIYSGNRVGVVLVSSVSATAATLSIATDDVTNFSAAQTVTLNGQARIAEA